MIKKEIEGAALLSIYNELKDEIKAIRTDIQHLNIQQPQQSENNQELNSLLKETIVNAVNNTINAHINSRKEQNIPKVFKRGKTYWSAKHFDKYFASKAPDSNITEWYSVEDLTEKFGMTTSAIYSFVSRFAIPKKKNQTAGILFKKTCRYCQRSC